ncbi:MAG: hypothetical protein COB04_10970 [Gammaproteobacteria bacterium]|nr:MAG: hypothetical protein COB04_10970 [Gammaproteobacteria bacterium]
MSNYSIIKKRGFGVTALASLLVLSFSLSGCGGDESDVTTTPTDESEIISTSLDGIWQGSYQAEGTTEDRVLYMIVDNGDATVIYDGFNLASFGSVVVEDAELVLAPKTFVDAQISRVVSLRDESMEIDLVEAVAPESVEDNVEMGQVNEFSLFYEGTLSVDERNIPDVIDAGVRRDTVFNLGFISHDDLEFTPLSYSADLQRTDLFDLPISRADLIGIWAGSSIQVDTESSAAAVYALELIIDEEGIVTGIDGEGCEYNGLVSVLDESINIVDINRVDLVGCTLGPVPIPVFRVGYSGQGFLNANKTELTIGVNNGSQVIAMKLLAVEEPIE